MTSGLKIRSPKSTFVSEKKLVVCSQMLTINLTKSNEHCVFAARSVSGSKECTLLLLAEKTLEKAWAKSRRSSLSHQLRVDIMFIETYGSH